MQRVELMVARWQAHTVPIATIVLLATCSGAPPIPAESGDGPEAVSLLGTPLFRPEIGGEARTTLEANLAAAQAAYDAAPQDPETLLWLGRRLAYLGRYRDAIAAFSRGISQHPRDARFYRHRGHRYITVRELDSAVRDLAQAADLVRGTPDEVEPDGAPNPFNIPRSTLQSNIFYHLALAHYLKGDFNRALPVWIEALGVSNNDDMHVATANWLYMTYRRLGQDADAARVLEPIRRDMEILENDAYHRRLLMYKGMLPADTLLAMDTGDPVQLATYGYGVGNWFLYNGDRARAVDVFERILRIPNWAAFGYIAAEAELARLR